MLPILTAAETAELDRQTEARGTTVATLMERAGHAVARAAVGLAGGAYGRRAVVVCGKGNNGGDGLVSARYLARWGMGVEVFLVADAGSLRGPGRMMADRLRTTGVPLRDFEPALLDRSLDRADVVVDAIFGTGFRGVPREPAAGAIRAIIGSPRRLAVVSIDVPSGVEGDSGVHHGPAIVADLTVAMGAPKVGDVLFPGSLLAGTVEVADIGFPPDLLRSDLWLVEAEDARDRLPVREPDTHKRRSGVVLVVAGSRRMTGAPRLVAEGAYRAGAGLVTAAVPQGILPVVQGSLAEATYVPLPEGPAGSASGAGWGVLEERLAGFGAVALGPGLSTDEETPALVRRLVRSSPAPLVIDADAINAFAGRAGDLARREAPAVLTPHTGEFARLFGMPAQEVVDDRIGLARKAAAETGCTVLLKGSRSVIASPEGEARVNPTGTPVLATGGTGDVLTGAIAAYLARGLAPSDAATVAAYVHGLAGQIAGERSGEGTVAGDVARALPSAIQRVREGG
jgi:ADP-dependent NAD(P)H-hydrate dehydratase / NAD(P)H-hydrate epimerase